MHGPEYISARDRFLQEPVYSGYRIDDMIQDGIQLMTTGIREVALEAERNMDRIPRGDDNPTIFKIHCRNSVALAYLSFLKELRNTAKDGKFYMKSVLTQINNATTGTLAAPIDLPEVPEIEELSPSELARLREELDLDPSLHTFLHQIGWGKNKFKQAAKFCERYNISTEFEVFGGLLKQKLEKEFNEAGGVEIPEFDGPPDPIQTTEPKLLKEGEYRLLPEGDEEKDREMRYVRGFSLAQIEVLKKLRGKSSWNQ